jgi:hypothetical protein
MNNSKQKQNKTFEIGDCMKSICVSDCYFAEFQNDNKTLLLYTEADDFWIRISVISFEPKEKAENPMFDRIIERAKEEGKECKIVGDKSYTSETKEFEKDGKQGITIFYDIGYKCHIILISVTAYSETSTTEKFKSVLEELPEYIASIQEVSLEEQNFFSPTYNDYQYIDEQCAKILDIKEEELEDFHERGETLKTIQKFIDEEKFGAQNFAELQALGVAFGDYIQHKYPDFQWAIIRDQYGRDVCLKYGKTTITIFPRTMISKRVEDGIKFNVESLFNETLKTIKDMFESNEYK